MTIGLHHTTSEQVAQPHQDLRDLLAIIVRLGDAASDLRISHEFRRSVPQDAEERFRAAWSRATIGNLVAYDRWRAGGTWALTDQGRRYVEPPPPKSERAPVTVAELRDALAQAEPVFEARAEARRRAHAEALAAERQALMSLPLGGRWTVETRLDGNIIQPLGGELAERGAYVRARLDRERGLIWFWPWTADRPQTPDDYLILEPLGIAESTVSGVLARVLLPALESDANEGCTRRDVEGSDHVGRKKAELAVDVVAAVRDHVRATPGASRRDTMRALRLSAAEMDSIESALERNGEIRIERRAMPGGPSARYFAAGDHVSQVSHER